MGSLKFDSTAMYNDIEKEAMKAINDVSYLMYLEMNKQLYGKAKNDNKIDYSRSLVENRFKTVITNYAYAILQSYGVGTGIDTESPFFEDYKNSSLWNPIRTSPTIVGRKEGTYDSVFGKDYSSGGMAGKVIKGLNKEATKAIQNVEEEFFEKGKAIDLISEQISYFIKNNSHKYFKYS